MHDLNLSSTFGMLLRAWSYRHFIYSSIKNEFLSRFARSRLGGLWMFIHPLAQVVIFAFVLSSILSSKLPWIKSQYAYPLYVMAGLLAWSLFSDLVSQSLTVFLNHGNLLKKPEEIFDFYNVLIAEQRNSSIKVVMIDKTRFDGCLWNEPQIKIEGPAQ